MHNCFGHFLMKLQFMDTLKSLSTAFYPMVEQMVSDEFLSRHFTFLAYAATTSSLFRNMVEHMMLFKFPSSHHMVFGMLCTFSLTVLIFEQHRAQLRFKPRTSTCFSQCQVLVFRKMSFPIHFNFSPLTGIFISVIFCRNFSTWTRKNHF